MPIRILYEDEWLLIVDKPAGLLTIPTPKREARTLTGILNAELKAKNSAFRLHPCHRLDRETSGLMIYAKGKGIQKKIMALFQARQIKKTYLAFIQGAPPKNHGLLDYRIDRQEAFTKYRIMERRKTFSIVEVQPLTGRKNQIRLHFKRLGHPLVGETKFAFRRDYPLRAKRVCLHAQALQFLHPVTKKEIKLFSPLPADMENFLRQHSQP